jgi:hypothetical protein
MAQLKTSLALLREQACNAALSEPNWTGLTALELAKANRFAPSAFKDWANAAANKVFGVWFDNYGLEKAMGIRKGFIEQFCNECEKEYFANR